ncbi:MAG: hypothetical protein WD231_05540 [Candidatus Woykebacteria bacterium]
MNFTLDTFRKYFLDITVFVSVFVTVLIGLSFINQLRENSRIIFGKLPPTQAVGEGFRQDFSLEISGKKLEGSSKVALVKESKGSVEKAKFLAKVFKIDGKLQTSKDTGGDLFGKIQDKNGIVNYNISTGAFSYLKISKPKSQRLINTLDEATQTAQNFLKKLNLEKDLLHEETLALKEYGLELDFIDDPKTADQFLTNLTCNFSDRKIYNSGLNPLVSASLSRSGEVVKFSYMQVAIDTENIGTYPLINLGGIENRLRAGQGRVILPGGYNGGSLSAASNVVFNDIELVYLIDDETGLLLPFWKLSGSATINKQEVEVVVVVNAVSSKYLKEN